MALHAYALSAQPLAAVLVIALGLAFLVYALERAFRYAEKHPLPALLSGTEIFQLVKDQVSAKDQDIIVESEPILGVPTQAIEQERKGDGHA